MASVIKDVVQVGEMTFRMPFENVIIPLEAEQLAELEASIKEHGVQVPILWDQHDRVIDGHNRIRIAEKYGITDIPVERIKVEDDDHAKWLAIELNLKRRHLNAKQRGMVAEMLIKMHPEKPARQIGEMAGVDHKTAQKKKDHLESIGEIPQCENVKTKDGRSYPRKRKPRKSAARKAAEEAQAILNGHQREPGEDDGLFDERDAEKDRKRREANKPAPAKLDAIGKPIPACQKDAFGDSFLADSISLLQATQKEIELLIERCKRKIMHYPFALIKDLYQHLDDAVLGLQCARESLTPAIPYVVCPKCDGKGCKGCRNGGHYPEWRYRELKEQEELVG